MVTITTAEKTPKLEMGMIGLTAVAKKAAAVVKEVLNTAKVVRTRAYFKRIISVASSDS